MRQVPEEQQIVDLKSQLLSHPTFRKWRGKMTDEEWNFLEGVLDGAISPSEFQKKLEEKFSGFKALGSILARLQRDERKMAFWKMEKALRQPFYLLPGESVADTKLVPITMIMLAPEVTIPFIVAVAQGSPIMEWLANGTYHFKGLAEPFPNLSGLIKSQSEDRDDKGRFLGDSCDVLAYGYLRDVITNFPELYKIPNLRNLDLSDRYFSNHGTSCSLISDGKTPEWLPEPFGPDGDCCERFLNAVAFLAIGMEQDEALSIFGREKAKKVATWQFKLPPQFAGEAIDWQEIRLKVGFLPARLQKKFSRHAPLSISRGTAYDLAASCWITRFNYVEFVEKNYPKYSQPSSEWFILNAAAIEEDESQAQSN